MIEKHLKLCLVTHLQDQPFSTYKQFILQAIKGGVTAIQLRDKSKDLLRIRNIALELKEILSPFSIPLIINDYIEIVKEIDADGIHLGQADISPDEARKILGLNKIIGWSIENFAQLERANQSTCIDYVAASAIFTSKTKIDCKTLWGLDGLKKLSQLSKYPIVAIGGINQNNIKSVFNHGANGVAVVSAIHDHHDPQQAVMNLISEINKSKGNKHV